MSENNEKSSVAQGKVDALVGHSRTEEVAALDDNVALYCHACNMEQALRGVMEAISQNNDYWEPHANPPFNPDAHIHVTLKASECEAVFDSLSNDPCDLHGEKTNG